MKAENYFKVFTPKNHAFFPLFENDAHNLVEATILLKELMSTRDKVEYERIYTDIQDIENAGDEITKMIYELLNKSFITPFDRKDIHELTSHIDEALGSINGISRRICIYKPGILLPVFGELAELISEAAGEIEKAVYCLKKPSSCKKIMLEAFKRVDIIEHNADDIYFNAVSLLFENEGDIKELLKNNKILDIMESCVDEEEDIADTLKTIVIKIL
jgi:uncharacterized protein Yka (UPF0111/DUF47 family)